MSSRLSRLLSLILILLLQSCSSDKLANFLEDSFSSIGKENINNQKDNDLLNRKNNKKSNLKKQPKVKEFSTQKESKKVNVQTTSKLSILSKNNIDNNKSHIGNNSSENKNENEKKNIKFEPKSYRLILILKNVNPSYPTDNFSKILRQSNINFEIERVEQFFKSDVNK